MVYVSERNASYFIVKSNEPFTDFAWEIKAKRRGYETERLVLQDINNEVLMEAHDKGAFTEEVVIE